MVRYYLAALLLLWHTGTRAQAHQDSLLLELSDERLYIQHRLLPGETVFSVAELYNVPSVVLAQNNDLSFYESLKGRTVLRIPLGSYNFRTERPLPGTPYRPLYYRRHSAGDQELLPVYLGVSPAVFTGWNPHAATDKVFQAGWVEYHAQEPATSTEQPAAHGNNPVAPGPPVATGRKSPVPERDTTVHSDHELMYDYQTDNGTMVDSLSGTVVFFKSQTKVSGNLYAFCNDIAKGRVVKIVNPSTGRFVLVRILGPMPATKLYHNALIGVDSRAQEILGVRDMKIWCKLYYK